MTGYYTFFIETDIKIKVIRGGKIKNIIKNGNTSVMISFSQKKYFEYF